LLSVDRLPIESFRFLKLKRFAMDRYPVEKATLSTRGRFVLPKALRDRKQLKPGCKFTWEAVPGGLMMRQIDDSDTQDARRKFPL
jgi:bifunctional DNA-binding transcriptional regulator/antitoxin component of YhaV-PrlF toxin-antitoxin module